MKESRMDGWMIVTVVCINCVGMMIDERCTADGKPYPRGFILDVGDDEDDDNYSKLRGVGKATD